MENASRALMMAASTILAIMLLSIFVYVFMRGARASQAIEEQKIKNQLMLQNSEFEHYNKDNNTFSDVISLINLVYNYNSERDFAGNDCITLTIDLNEGNKIIINSSVKERNKALIIGELKSVYAIAEPDGVLDGKNFSETRYDLNDGTVYRYYFVPDKTNGNNPAFEYDLEEGDLKAINLELQQNSDW